MLCGGKGSMPKFVSFTDRLSSLIPTTLIELDPMSSPIQFLAMVTSSYIFLPRPSFPSFYDPAMPYSLIL